METVTIPEGWFWMGQADDGPGQDDERPHHKVWVDTFQMARYQVTNREYAGPASYWVRRAKSANLIGFVAWSGCSA